MPDITLPTFAAANWHTPLNLAINTINDAVDAIVGLPGTILASTYGAAVGNSAAANTSALQDAADALVGTAANTTLLLDWAGTADINDEIVFGAMQGKTIRGLSWFSTHLRQTTNDKAGLAFITNVSGVTAGVARCSITDLMITHSTLQGSGHTRAYGICFENGQHNSNTYFGLAFDRLYIGSFYRNWGLRQPAVGGPFSFGLWGSSLGATWMELHDAYDSNVYWGGGSVGQPENTIGSLYCQDWARIPSNGGSGHAANVPSVWLQNVEVNIGSLGIEDHHNDLLWTFGDEVINIGVFHIERWFPTTAGRNGWYQGHNSVQIATARVYDIRGDQDTAIFAPDASANGTFEIGALVTSNVTNTGTTVVMANGARHWRVRSHTQVSGSIDPYAVGDTAAAASLIEFDGVLS